MLLSGRGTTRIKRGHRIWPNHTPRSMSIQWDTVLFGRMGSPNIYKLPKVGKDVIEGEIGGKSITDMACKGADF